MFDSLTGKLQNAFRNLRGLGKISENNVADSLREVRMALLDADVNFKSQPSCLMMVGLHGSGKTTSSGKLARLLQKQGRTPLLVAADVYRPAAMDQLATLGQELGLPVFVKKGETGMLKIAREALDYAQANQCNTLIFDTSMRRSEEHTSELQSRL